MTAARFALLLALLPFMALAHGDAAWIQQAHPQCCGVADCKRIDAIALRGGFYLFPHPTKPGVFVRVPQDQVKRSEDGSDWACFYMDYATGVLSDGARPNCLFLAERV